MSEVYCSFAKHYADKLMGHGGEYDKFIIFI
jgi:hypothetical protein